MPPEPLILAFDTSAAHCAAALLSGDKLLVTHAEEMGRGQAERLIPMLEELLGGARRTWADIDAIGVGVGPGNFSGIRISVAAARGLALALKIPAVGVTGFDAAGEGHEGPHLVAIAGPRGSYYAQERGPEAAPVVLGASEFESFAGIVVRLSDIPAAEIAANIARVAARRWREPQPRPAPFYMRPADAAPMREAPPAILP